MADSDFSTLEKIITKVRRLTRSPSQAQLTDQSIKDYINTFILYDLPQHIRDNALRRNFTFYAVPYIDTYQTDSTNVNSPLYNFINKYVSIHPPVYIAGRQARLCQNQSEFYSNVNKVVSIVTIANGNGADVNFAGTLNVFPVMQREVMFSAVDGTGNGIVLVDNPTSVSTGDLIIPNDTSVSYGTINYLTGVYVIAFPAAPAANTIISSQTIPYIPGIPSYVLFFDNKLTVYPIPDHPYRIDIEAYARPDELTLGQMPMIAEWWQYIAYGASKKVFEDRMDMDSIQMIMPEFKTQQELVLSRTVVQLSNERAVDDNSYGTANPWSTFNNF
jgi:hypothetical protein